jgi:diadenosine tetraphosphate (Ap4A) HIT family hydrolase
MDASNEEPILRLLKPDEQLHAVAKADDARILVTDRRVAVAVDDRVALDITIDQLRRIQFDIEKSRPATLVVVPERPSDPPQVLVVPKEHYREVADALAVLGELMTE